MESLILEIRNPETVHAIVEVATRQGTTPEAYALELIETALLAQRPFEDVVEPIAQSFDDSGMTEDELDDLIARERQAIWEEKDGVKTRPKFILAEMAPRMPKNYCVKEESFGEPIGREEW